MNKSYKSVWNESTGSWVAVSELATGRSKSKRAKTAISKAILTQIAVGGMSLAGASAVMAGESIKMGTGAAVSVADGVAIGTDAEAVAESDPKFAGRTGAVAIGDQAYASGSGVAIGQGAQASSDSFAMGAGATAINGSTALGNDARSFNKNTVAIGNNAAATAENAVSVGANTTNEFTNSVALGQGSVTDRANSVSVGSNTVKRQITNVADATKDSDAVTFNQLKSIGIKTDAAGAVTNSFVAYDADKAQALITLGGAGGTKITNVAAGNVAAGSTDAINGAQLLGVAQSAAAAIGGSSTVGADGKITKPTYTVGGATFDNVGDAINKAASIGGSGTGGGTDDLAVHYDSAAQSSVKLGKDASPVKMTNLAKGTADTDAVNVSQLNAATNGLDGAVSNLKYIGISATSTGAQAVASGKDALSVGGSAFATGDGALAFGTNARASAKNAVAIGTGSTATKESTFSIGSLGSERRLVNVAIGTGKTDAVNLGQVNSLIAAATAPLENAQSLQNVKSNAPLKSSLLGATVTGVSVSADSIPSSAAPEDLIRSGKTDKAQSIGALGDDSIAIGLNTHSNGDMSVAVGSNVNSVGTQSVAVGYGTIANGTAAQAFGVGANAVSDGGLALGLTATVNENSDNAIAIGTESTAVGVNAISIGTSSTTIGLNAVALGQAASATGAGSMAFGNTTEVDAVGSIAIGNNNSVTGAGTVVLGSNVVKATGKNSVVLGDGSDGSQNNVVSVGAKGKERKIVNVAAGTTATDAVNLAQLNAAITGPGATDTVIYDTSAHDKVTFGKAGVSTTLSNVAAGVASTDAVNVSQLTAMGGKVDSNGVAQNSFVAYDNASKDSIALQGLSGKTKITNLANGTLSAASSDAVNGSQLFNTASSAADAIGGGSTLDPATGKISKPSIKVGTSTFDNVAGAVVAAGTAATDAGTAAAAALAGSIDAVKYDSTAHTKVTLGGTGAPVVLTNVAAGTTTNDAVNFGQLTALGGKVDSNGVALNSFVAYDNNTSKDTITLQGATSTKITKLTNGTLSAASSDAVNGSQLFNTASTAAEAIGGGSTLDPATGKISKPSIKVGTSTFDNVAGAVVAAGTAATDAVTAAAAALAGSVDAVKYDSSAHTKVTLGGTGAPVVLTNVAAGTTTNDAVNFGQLTALGGKVDSNGVALNSFVAYDNNTSKDTITLQGATSTKITKLTNGTLSAASSDAVNGSQLFNTASTAAEAIGGGSTLDPATGKISKPSIKVGTSTYDNVAGAVVAAGTAATDAVTAAAAAVAGSVDAVKYDSSAHTKVTLGGTGAPVVLTNVAAGTTTNDAVNFGQLTALGGKVDSNGNALNSFVAYDNNTSKDTITLQGATSTKITKLTNGTLSAASSDAVNGSQLFAVASSAADAIGGGSKLDATGTITKPSVKVGDTTYDNLASAVTAAAALAGSGSTEGVVYDTTAHDKVTFGKAGGAPVVLSNVAQGTKGTDAVNLDQLNALGGKVDSNGVALNSFVAYDNNTSKDTITLQGATSTKITNLANGTLSAASSDAVNGSQLFNTASSAADAIGGGSTLDPATGKISKPSIKVGTSTFDNVAGAVVAAGTAATDAGTAAAAALAGSIDAVKYDSTAHTKVTLGGTGAPVVLTNVAAGTTTNDAVNFGQLTALGGKVDSNGVALNSFVAYDNNTSKDTITLQGATSTKITKLTNGTLSAASSDAVNGSQLFNTASSAADAIGGGSTLDPATGKISKPSIKVGTSTFDNVAGAVVAAGTAATDAGTAAAAALAGSIDAVKYDSTAHTKVTLGGTGAPVVLTNVAAGTTTNDAVNFGQLTALGGKVDSNGVALNSFVAYDNNTSKDTITLQGATSTKITKLTNGTLSAASSDAVNGSQLFNTASTAAEAIGGGSTLDPATGKISKPSIKVGTSTFDNVAGAVVAAGTAATDAVTAAAAALAGSVDAVKYDSTAHTKVTLGGTGAPVVLTNVAAGTTTNDAVNFGQLTALGGKVDSNGVALNSFVAYDNNTSKDTITLQGATSTKITKLTNGTLSAASSDAVNGSQLFNTASTAAEAIGGGSTLDPATGKISKPSIKVGTSTFDNVAGAVVAAGTAATDAVTAAAAALAGSVDAVKYDSSAHTKVTLGGTGAPVVLTNVAAGTTTNDAVNFGQLTALGGKVDSNGNALNSFVAYDNNTSKDTITLQGATSTKITKLTNGTLSAASSDAVNGSQLFNTASSTADALGGGSKLDAATGKISKPLFTVGSSTYDTVAAAIDAAAKTGSSADSVNYDAPDHKSVTLGSKAAGPVVLSNVAQGKLGTDAVNVDQLTALGGKVDSNGVALNAFVAYDTAAKGSVTLNNGGAPVTVANVKTGVADNDAVNVAQLNTAMSSNTALAASLKYVAFGSSKALIANATGTDSMALGGNAFATAGGALALGLNSRAGFADSVALGKGSTVSVANTVSVGSVGSERRIMNVAIGLKNTDAVNLGQVNSLIAGLTEVQSQQVLKSPVAMSMLKATVVGATAQNWQDMMASGETDKLARTSATGTDATAIGLNSHANDDFAVAIGQNANATAMGAVAIGNAAISNGIEATAVGVNASVTATHALAVGFSSVGDAEDSIAIGTMATVGTAGKGSVAIGNTAEVIGAGSFLMGNNTQVTGSNTFVLGSNIAEVKGSNSVVLGSGSDGSQNNVVSVGGKGSERKIVNVAAGTTTTDAVNLGQMTKAIKDAGTGTGTGGGGDTLVTQASPTADVLVASATGGKMNFAGNGADRELTGVAAGTKANSAVALSQLQPVVDALGGGAAIDKTTGAVTGPTYIIGGKTKHSVGDALTAVDGNLTTVNTDIGKMQDAIAAIGTGTGDGLVIQDSATGNITVGALTGGDTVDVSGKNGVQRKISGVAPGLVSRESFDAINGSQLANVSNSVASAIGGGSMMTSDGSISSPSFKLENGKTSVYNVGDAISNLDGRVTNLAAGGAATPNAVAYDTSKKDVLTVGTLADANGNNGQKTKITNLQDGDVSATSTDAVTGKQLFEIQDSVKNIASTGNSNIGINGKDGANGINGINGAPGVASATGNDAVAMGDNAAAKGDGALAIGGNAGADGKDAIAQGNNAKAGADGAIAIGGSAGADGKNAIAIGGNAGAAGVNSIAIGNGASAPADNAVALGANSVADRNNTVSVGSEGAERQVTNVAAGTKGTDAVNLNQMNSAMGGIARKAYSGIAAATALTMIPDVDANKTLSIGIGGGTFQGYAATAIGGTARITQNIKVRVGAGWSGAGTTVGAGASYQW